MKRKSDRRTRYTRAVIKQAFLEQLRKQSFSKLTVTAICKEADITRATFYLHYTDIFAVLDEILNEALNLSESSTPVKDLRELLGQIAQENDSPSFIKENYALLPVCQRIADNPQYQALFSDDTLGPYILQYIVSHEKAHIIPFLQEQFHLDAMLAENLYLFLVSGSFTLNQHHKWKKDEDWFQIQSMLLRFIYFGSQALKNSKKNHRT